MQILIILSIFPVEFKVILIIIQDFQDILKYSDLTSTILITPFIHVISGITQLSCRCIAGDFLDCPAGRKSGARSLL